MNCSICFQFWRIFQNVDPIKLHIRSKQAIYSGTRNICNYCRTKEKEWGISVSSSSVFLVLLCLFVWTIVNQNSNQWIFFNYTNTLSLNYFFSFLPSHSRTHFRFSFHLISSFSSIVIVVNSSSKTLLIETKTNRTKTFLVTKRKFIIPFAW